MWNWESVRKLFTIAQSLPASCTPYSIYFITFSGFCIYVTHWFMQKRKESCKQPHPLYVKGKLISHSVTCNPNNGEFETLDSNVHTVTDIRKCTCSAGVIHSLCYTYGEKPALYHAKQWLSYSSLIRGSEIFADIVEKNAHTNAPVCVLGDFSSIKCSGNCVLYDSLLAILGLVSIGRSVVFITQDKQPADIFHILEEQHCEVILLKHSRLSQLEEALQCSYCSSLRVVLFTDDDYIDKGEGCSGYLAEESLTQTHNLEVLSLSHVIMSEYACFGDIPNGV